MVIEKTHPNPSDPVIVFLDLDKTLVTVNTIGHFVRWLILNGVTPRHLIWRTFTLLIKTKISSPSLTDSTKLWLSIFQGWDEAILRNQASAYFCKFLKNKFRTPLLKVVEDHRKLNHHLVLLTGTSSYIAELVSSHLNLESYYSSRLITQNGKLTGAVVEPLCLEESKLEYAREACRVLKTNLSNCWFYSDSCFDLPLLNAVSIPVAVHPDVELRAVAASRNWKIIE